MSEAPIVVIDNGGNTLKAGIAGDDHPSVVIPSGVGLQDFLNLSDPDTFNRFMEISSSGDLKVRNPIKNGTVTNWEDMETIWRHAIQDNLHINPEESSILMTEPMGNPKPAREKIGEILFESLNFNAISIATAPILPMYAAGRTTGIVLDVGDGITQVVPVWGGYPITQAMERVDFGGRDITQLFSREQQDRNDIKMPHEVFKLLKEKTCHVVLDYNQAKESSSVTKYQLPNGEDIEVGEEVFKCPEFLFNPMKIQESEATKQGLHQLVYKAIMKTNIDVRKDLYANIVLSGGSTLFPGFVERLEAELKALAPSSVKIKIVAHPARKYFSWIGGSVLASLTSFPDTLITKQSWEEGSGRAALHKLYS
ncbi:unnamed protein product [Orchesella dallaii]|uniref:Actin n=1 Tax=Orchesella dallaii TaxID=48710 RepID=A0ABP1RC87_9HEXA